MAARLSTACLVLAALCGAGWATRTAAAKPPDLPLKETIYCAPPTPAEDLSQFPGADEDTHARAAEVTALRTVSRCVLFGAHPLLALLPVEEWLVDEEAMPEFVLPPDDDPRYREPPVYPPKLVDDCPRPNNTFTCPYLREKANKDQASSAPESALPTTVFENLEKLEQAARLYRQAASCRRAGRTDEARGCYESIHELCPGSRYDRLAGEKLQAIEAQQSRPATEATGEEQEVPAPSHGKPGCGRQKEATHDEEQSALGVDAQVAALLERCQHAFHNGQYAEAEALARRALTLSPEKVAAHPLVYKLHLLTLLQPSHCPNPIRCFGGEDPEAAAITLLCRYAELFKQGLYAEAQLCALQALALDPQNPTARAAVRLATMQRLEQFPPSEPAPCPWAGEPRTVMRPPELPPIDPTVSGAMDKILTAVGEPDARGITVTVVERGTEEGAEPAAEVTPVLIGPAGDDPAKVVVHTLPLEDLVDMLRSMACVEVDGFPLPARGRCHMPLGCVCADLSWDGRGEHGSFCFGVGMCDPTSDLRTEQAEHNERVLRWIERHSSGNEAGEEEEAGQP
jgi:tetratricopeptide (TPR) repeat protein